MKNVLVLLVFVAAVIGLYELNRRAQRPDGTSVLHVAKPISIDVETATPEQVEIVRLVQAPGDVEAYDEVDISSELVSKIVEMPVKAGSVVEQGNLLCRLDDAEYRARVLSAEANVAKAQAQLRQAEADFEKADRDLKRQIQFAERGNTSAIELADYRLRQVSAEAVQEMRRQELIQADAMLQSSREDLAKTVITAPISGVVSQLFAQQGEVVVTGTMNNPGTRILVVSDLSRMIVRCRIDEGDAALVKSEQPARIYLQADTRKSVPGKVMSMATKGTKATGRDVVTFEALVLITESDESVMPGMTANVEIEVARRGDAVTIPVEAVVYRKRRDLPQALVARYDETSADEGVSAEAAAQYLKLVFRVREGKAQATLVETGISDARRVEIVSGVALGDEVVTGPYRSLDQLADLAAVKILPKPSAAPTPAAEEGAVASGAATTNGETQARAD